MIISASRRTDIPAWHAGWFIKQLRAGKTWVQNPFNPTVKREVSLKREDVDCIVFWTRNAKPLLPYLQEIKEAGYPVLFLYTITPYGDDLEPGFPPLEKRLSGLKELASRMPPGTVIWRYDPIILTPHYTENFHREKFEEIAQNLGNFTSRCIISFVQFYRKCRSFLMQNGAYNPSADEKAELLRSLLQVARLHGIDLQTCSSEEDLSDSGVPAGACIDAKLINSLYRLNVETKKDPGQRKACLCSVSTDIGTYGTCRSRCVYCYAR
ncbi:MAG TPA: DUF1848 domain-containing protein [Bacteroidales bacterium]|nr:DUF1848 domain-containing protein [Bacteroidales bacterium]HQK37194.1 DUF1848 domain-containing protein [Bacteroidales bacterium]